jgi:hypothetical protein
MDRKPLEAMIMNGTAENPEKGERFGYFRRPGRESAVFFFFLLAVYLVAYLSDHGDIPRKE